MKRREFLKSTAAVGAGGLFSSAAKVGAHEAPDSGPVPGRQPNILFIIVDELRYPTVFPGNIKTPGEFLAKYMPNVHSLWDKGVKFGNYHTAANACTPSRGVMISGLYSQQSWLITTILSTPYPEPTAMPQPVLNPAFPTFGKLLQQSGYQTPYFGKWHVSNPTPDPNTLAEYGFDFHTYYDPTGTNLQGTYGDENRGYHNDEYSAGQAVEWLGQRKSSDAPWCTTVSLINPHDREFFPAGTEYQTVDGVFANNNPSGLAPFVDGYGTTEGTGPVVPWEKNKLKSPKSYGYPTIPPNWENAQTLSDNKPSTHTFVRDFSAGVWGGITDDPNQDVPSIDQYPNRLAKIDLKLGIAKMPYSYWQRGLDSYTQVMGIVDQQIGRVLCALYSLPKSIVENTVIVFVADHGEYSGAHGIVQGKIATVYEEAWHIPLIVVDPSHRFTGDTCDIRDGLTSSVDLSTMLVSLGNRGTRDWMKGYLSKIYGKRHDVISMLKSKKAPGRPYVLYATDEVVPDILNFNRCPTHVLGMRTDEMKLGVYTKWLPLTSTIIRRSAEKEFYDYATEGGRLELDNTAKSDARVDPAYRKLLNQIVPDELQEKLPPPLRGEQEKSKLAHLLYRELTARKFLIAGLKGDTKTLKADLQNVLGYGGMF